MAQLVACWTPNPKIVGSILTATDCFIWDNILGQDAYLSLPRSDDYLAESGFLVMRLIVAVELVCSQRELRLSERLNSTRNPGWGVNVKSLIAC